MEERAYWIAAGQGGHAVMLGRGDRRLYEWVEGEKKWKVLDDSWASRVALGEGGRVYKIDFNSERIFR